MYYMERLALSENNAVYLVSFQVPGTGGAKLLESGRFPIKEVEQEVKAKIRHFDFNIVTYLAWYEPWQGGRMSFGPFGVMGEVGYRFTLIWELAARYSITYLTPSLRTDARSYGEFQIANATDLAEAQAQYGENGDQTTTAELALAGTAHIIGNSLKTVLEVAWQNQLWAQGLRNGLRINLQLQFLF